jgi:quinoprotein dehydrogenase-associated probable ABC transporter substrate-binding protein
MSLRSSALFVALVLVIGSLLVAVAHARGEARRPPLRVCADPNNLPYSNDRAEGFENALATLVADDLGRSVAYTWWPQRRGFIRTTLRAGVCDVVMGVPASFELTLNTRPYYESTYVFVSRRDRQLHLQSLDDPRLRTLTIGVPLPGEDYADVPPVDALATRHIVSNLRGYTLTGDYSQPNPPAALIDAVTHGDVDVAIAWGPLAGFFAARSSVPLEVVPIAGNDPGLRFAIAVGVRRGNQKLQRRVNDTLARKAADVDALLVRYHIPHDAPAARRVP